MSRLACVDIGSTCTKAALVGLPEGELLATRQVPTTHEDVVRGVLAATEGWAAPVTACSSAGGGLRLAVVGYEELISAEAGRRAALSAGARVVHVAAGRLDDAVLSGVTVLAALRAGAAVPGVVVVDVGGATTDVYCVPDPDAEQAALGREAVGVPPRRRTVEGDLGVAASRAELRRAARAEDLAVGEDPLALGGAAATVALRRHLRAEAAYGPGGASARTAGLVVLSGGVFRHAGAAAQAAVVARIAADAGGAGAVLAGSEVVADRDYVLAAVGLLSAEHPAAARRLAARLAGTGARREGSQA